MTDSSVIIDETECWGCKTCELACKQEMQPSDGVKLIVVTDDGPRMENNQLVFFYRVNM